MKKPKPGGRIQMVASHAVRRMRDALTEGWYLPGDEMSGNRACHLQFNYTNNLVANLVGGNFYTGLMLLLNADDGFIGMMSMFVFAANLMQLLSPLLLERFTRRKGLLIGVRAVIHLINIVLIGLIPLFPASTQSRLVLFGASVFLLNFLSALIAPGFSVWHIQFIPQNIRVKYFSLLSMTNGILVAVFNLVGGRIVDACKAAGSELVGLELLRLAALAIAVYDLLQLARMKEYPYRQDAKRTRLFDLLIRPFREVKYLKTVAIAFLWNMMANIPGSYYTVYLLRNMEASYSFINLVNLLNVPILLLLTPLWSRLLRRFSWLAMLNIAIALYAPHYFLLGLVTKGSVAYLYPLTMVYAFSLAVGINLAFTNVPYINIPQSNQTIFIGFYSTMCNLGALLGVTFGRQFVTMTESMALTPFGLPLVNKQALMFTVSALMGLAALAIYFLRRGNEES